MISNNLQYGMMGYLDGQLHWRSGESKFYYVVLLFCQWSNPATNEANYYAPSFAKKKVVWAKRVINEMNRYCTLHLMTYCWKGTTRPAPSSQMMQRVKPIEST